jgi:hypothetical protein
MAPKFASKHLYVPFGFALLGLAVAIAGLAIVIEEPNPSAWNLRGVIALLAIGLMITLVAIGNMAVRLALVVISSDKQVKLLSGGQHASTIRLAIEVDEDRLPLELTAQFPAENIALVLDEIPWPRLPIAGEVYLGPGYPYVVESLYFDSNGDVTIYLKLDEPNASDETYLQALKCARGQGWKDWS